MLACPHPVRCRATAAAGDGGRVRRKVAVRGTRGAKGWKLLCRVTEAEGRELEMFQDPILQVKSFRLKPQQAVMSA